MSKIYSSYWINPDNEPQENQLILVAWKYSDNHIICVNIRHFKKYKKNGDLTKFPFGVTHKVYGWIPIPQDDGWKMSEFYKKLIGRIDEKTM